MWTFFLRGPFSTCFILFHNPSPTSLCIYVNFSKFFSKNLSSNCYFFFSLFLLMIFKFALNIQLQTDWSIWGRSRGLMHFSMFGTFISIGFGVSISSFVLQFGHLGNKVELISSFYLFLTNKSCAHSSLSDSFLSSNEWLQKAEWNKCRFRIV